MEGRKGGEGGRKGRELKKGDIWLEGGEGWIVKEDLGQFRFNLFPIGLICPWLGYKLEERASSAQGLLVEVVRLLSYMCTYSCDKENIYESLFLSISKKFKN